MREPLDAELEELIAGARRCRDDAELRALLEPLLRSARTDPLTGLANRRALDATLEIEIERAGRYGRALSLVLLDLDDLKRTNDEHGHPAGDRALRDVAQTLREHCRSSDLPARHGGDELAVVLPETAASGAHAFAGKVLERLRALGRSVSLGTASLGSDAADAKELFASADRRLYQAKRRGGNQVVESG